MDPSETEDFGGLGGKPFFLRVPPWLQVAWVQQLRLHFDFCNYEYLGYKLKRPLIELGLSLQRLGQWNGALRRITISMRHILEHPWESVLDTLRHEMAHQYVEEVLGHPGGLPHGDAFAHACRLLRIDPACTAGPGTLGKIEESSAERDKILSRVKLLLALARSPNEHEAANAMRMANKYLLKYNLELADVGTPRNYSTRYLGRCTGRVQEYEYTLAHILQEHFFVCVIWTNSYDPFRNVAGRKLQISGTSENLEIAEYVYNYVMSLSKRLWAAHRRECREAGGTKLQYLAGLLRGLHEKLDSQRRELKEELGLVWLGDSALKEYFRYLYPRTIKCGGYGVTRGERYEAGLEDGRKINIHKGIGSKAQSRGKLIE